MNRAVARAALLSYALLATACSSLGTAPSRPSPAPAPPVSRPVPPPAPSPDPAPQSRSDPGSARIPSRPPGGAVAPPRPQSDSTSASSALLAQSRTQRAAGSLPAAKASLERALRLAPNDPEVWLELGELELQTGNNAQAATMARKALSLAGRDYTLAARAQRLVRAAE
jgi:tetratricopeptide (TPR) repeat protein